MNAVDQNRLAMAALGISKIEWQRNRRTEADWRVLLDNGMEFTVTTPLLGTESSALRIAAGILMHSSRQLNPAGKQEAKR